MGCRHQDFTLKHFGMNISKQGSMFVSSFSLEVKFTSSEMPQFQARVLTNVHTYVTQTLIKIPSPRGSKRTNFQL